jgi:hypothetical protein
MEEVPVASSLILKLPAIPLDFTNRLTRLQGRASASSPGFLVASDPDFDRQMPSH